MYMLFVSQARVPSRSYALSLANQPQVNASPQNLVLHFIEVSKNLFSVNKNLFGILHHLSSELLLFLFLCVSQPVLLLLCFIICFSYLLPYSTPSGCPASPVPSIQDRSSILHQLPRDTFMRCPHSSHHTSLYTHIQTPVVLVAQILTNLQDIP